AQRVAQAVNRPCHDDIELPPAGVLEHGIEARPSVSSLGAGDACVAVDLHDVPTTPPGDLPKLADLIFNGLCVRADSHIQRRALVRHRASSFCAPSIPHWLYIYQPILVCQIRDNPAVVSIQFLKGTEGRVFCMAFTRFLASSVTAKIAARMPSWRTATSRGLRRLSVSSSV